MGQPKDQLIFVGTYTNLGAKGIYTCHLNGATGQLTELSVANRQRSKPVLRDHSPKRQVPLFSI